MRRALRGAVGTVVVSGILGLPCLAPAQAPPLIQGRPAPMRKVGHEGNTALTSGRNRLEEMKVELALLADLTTFPYDLGGRVAGEKLELRGWVPNDLVRQRALAIARLNTSLHVADGLKIQAGWNVRPPVRGAEALQKEGVELLSKHLGALAWPIHVEARSSGVVVLTGPINSIEEKLAVCKLFRQLAGCTGIIDRLNVPPILRDGQRVVAVTKDSSLTAPPMAAMTKSLPPAAIPRGEPAVVSVSKPVRSSLDAQDGELRMPTIVTAKPAAIQPTAAGAKADDAGSLKPPAPLIKSGQSDPGRETVKSGEKLSKAPEKTSPALTKPVVPWAADSAGKTDNTHAVKPPPPVMKWGEPAMSWESQTKPKTDADTVKEPNGKTTPAGPVEKRTSKPAHKSKPEVFASEQKPAKSSNGSTGASVVLTAPTTPQRWQRPGSSEESEPRVEPAPAKGIIVFDEEPVTKPVTKPLPAPAATATPAVRPSRRPLMPEAIARTAPAAAPATLPERRSVRDNGVPPPRRVPTPATTAVVRLDRPSRWPPAYDVRPAQPKDGRPGVLIFDDEPAPVPNEKTAMKRPVVPAELQRQIAAVCGRKAHDVRVEVQRDGSVQVRVKVASASISDQLTHKILTIPEMASPSVHLTMDISP
jgi:hypothetical protein